MGSNLIRNQQVVGSIPTAGSASNPSTYSASRAPRQGGGQGGGQGTPGRFRGPAWSPWHAARQTLADRQLAGRLAVVQGARRGFDALLARAAQSSEPDALLERAAELLALRSTLVGRL